MRIGVLYSRVRPEEKLLFRELERRRADVTLLDDRKIVLAFGGSSTLEPAFDFDVVFDRSLSYSRALAQLRVLADRGVTTVNRIDVVENCGDKLRTSSLLQAAGVPTPETRVASTPQAALQAIEELGYPRNPDYNGAAQDGFAYYQVCQKGGLRHSAFRAFLKPALKRPNLALRTHALVERVVIEDGRAVGVEYRRGGRLERAAAGRGIVLAAGAVQSPQLLELSGIGRPEVLQAQGVAVQTALPGVGENYRDHYMTRLSWRIARPVTLNERSRGLALAGEVLRYVLTRRGLLTTAPGVVAGFVRTRADLAAPDVQYHIVPASYDNAATKALAKTPGMTIGAYQTRPESAGAIHIRSPRADEQPSIRGNYLAADHDRRALVAGMKIARALMETEAMRRHVAFEEAPGPEVRDDAAWLDFARRTGQAIYHPVGTCKMGVDPMAVVDPRLRVHGVPGLRVADASIMPTLTNGNTHAPTVMIAEKAAAMMLEDGKG